MKININTSIESNSKLYEEIVKNYVESSFKCGLINKPETEETIRTIYRKLNLVSPERIKNMKFIWVNSPLGIFLGYLNLKFIERQIKSTNSLFQSNSIPKQIFLENGLLKEGGRLHYEVTCRTPDFSILNRLDHVRQLSLQGVSSYLEDRYVSRKSFSDITPNLWPSFKHAIMLNFHVQKTGISNDILYNALINLPFLCHLCCPLKDVCLCSEFPVNIYYENEKLHNDGGPALVYKDGFSVYALRGIMVPQEIAEKPADEINLDIFMKTRNVEVRKEIINKVGIDNLYKNFGARVIDKKNGYELVLLNLEKNVRYTYLKMVNPSTGQLHLEGVDPDCNSVSSALKWRNGTSEIPKILT